MTSRSVWSTGPEVRAEVGIFAHEGHEYSAGGAYVSPEIAAGYPDLEAGTLKAWDGTVIGAARSVASWPIRSWIGSHMHQVECVVEGRTYTGRGFGSGMLWRGRAKRGCGR